MSEDAILIYVKSIDERTARMETAMTKGMADHQNDDNIKHEKLAKRIGSLEFSRKAIRVAAVSFIAGGAGGAVKLGWVDKLISLISG